MNKRIYRSLTTSSGTEFHYLATVTADTTVYSDTAADNNLGEVLPSASWAMPPADLKGIIILANGIACGFRWKRGAFLRTVQALRMASQLSADV